MERRERGARERKESEGEDEGRDGKEDAQMKNPVERRREGLKGRVREGKSSLS